MANIGPLTITCPTGHYQGATAAAAVNGSCKSVSYPKLENNIFWQNSSYYIGVGALSPQFQQHVVTLYDSFIGTSPPTLPSSFSSTAHGSCITITLETGAYL